MTTKIKPVGDKLLIKPIEAPESTPGGIVLPHTAQGKPNEGVVIEVGEGRLLDSGEHEPVCVDVGDTVLYSGFGDTKVDVDGVKHIILSEGSILAVKTVSE